MNSQQKELLNRRLDENLLLFKSPYKYSYRRFRDIMQVLDAIKLDYSHLKFKHQDVVSAVLFMTLSNYLKSTQYNMFYFERQSQKSPNS